MEPTVLAGPVEFTPADIAMILAVLVGAFLVLTSPGWLLLAFTAARRTGPGASTGARAAAGLGGAVLGIALSAGLFALVLAFLGSFSSALVVASAAAWVACWAVSLLLRRPSGASRPDRTPHYGP